MTNHDQVLYGTLDSHLNQQFLIIHFLFLQHGRIRDYPTNSLRRKVRRISSQPLRKTTLNGIGWHSKSRAKIYCAVGASTREASRVVQEKHMKRSQNMPLMSLLKLVHVNHRRIQARLYVGNNIESKISNLWTDIKIWGQNCNSIVQSATGHSCHQWICPFCHWCDSLVSLAFEDFRDRYEPLSFGSAQSAQQL